MNIVAIIGARLNSSRLPAKHLLPLAGKPLIERLVERLKRSQSIDQMVLATTADDFNQPLIDWAKGKLDCYVHHGDVNDLMGRVDAVVTRYNPDIIVYICGDSPLVSHAGSLLPVQDQLLVVAPPNPERQLMLQCFVGTNVHKL